MKKTITINISQRTFQIEEDAYQLLNTYLQNLENYFAKEDPDGEIVTDIEERLSELFAERKRLGIEVLTIEEVRGVLDRVGSVDEIAEESLDEDAGAKPFRSEDVHHSDEQAQREEPVKDDSTKTETKSEKNYYRHPTDRWIGGVLGALGVYLSVDSNLLRLLFIILLFTPVGTPLLIVYIAACIFVPKAKYVTEILEMEGEPITVQSIWKRVSQQNEQQKDKDADDRPIGRASHPASAVADDLTIKREKAKSKSKSWGWGTWLGLIFIILVLLSIFGYIFGLTNHYNYNFTGPFLVGNIITDVVTSMFAFASGLGIFAIFIVIPICIILALILLAFLGIAVVPIGLIIRNRTWSVGTKIIGILIWLAFMYWVFA